MIKFILKIFFSLIICTNILVAKDMCDYFFGELKNQTSELQLWGPPDYIPVDLIFKFGSYFDIDTVENEVSFNYSIETFWDASNMIDVAKKTSDNFMNGDGFYCGLNLREYNDEGLIVFWPDVRIQKIKDTKLKNEDIQIEFNYFPEEEYVEGVSYHKSFVTLHKNLILNNFPLDKQTLKFIVSDENIEISEAYIQDNEKTLEYLNSYKSYDREWSLIESTVNLEEIKSTFYEYDVPSVVFKLEVERNPSYYIYKVVLPILILLIVLFSSVIIPPRQLESKLTLTVVCFLALIAYIFVIDESVPKLSYMTLMDYFILISFIFSAFPNIYAIYEFTYFQKNNSQHKHARKIGILLPIMYFSIVLFVIIFNANSFKLSSGSFLNPLIF